MKVNKVNQKKQKKTDDTLLDNRNAILKASGFTLERLGNHFNCTKAFVWQSLRGNKRSERSRQILEYIDGPLKRKAKQVLR